MTTLPSIGFIPDFESEVEEDHFTPRIVYKYLHQHQIHPLYCDLM